MLGSNQLRKNRYRHHQASPIEGRRESRPYGQAESGIFVPQRVHNISINGGRHRPRNSRSHLRMLFLPDPISGLPIPRYFENVLWLRTGRTRIPFPSLSNNRRSPARTPKMRRSSRDTVIFHLLVIRACFCISNPVPYFGTFSLRETGDPAPAPGAANPDYPITIGSGIRLAVAVLSAGHDDVMVPSP